MSLKEEFYNLVLASLISMFYLVIILMDGHELTNDENLTVFIVLTMIIFTVFFVWDFIVFLYKTVT